LKQQEVLPEKGLEQALLDHLLQVLLELGKGFCFEARHPVFSGTTRQGRIGTIDKKRNEG
jgi:predicted nuclease of restriction endonuclease-like (RecB) superfamily